MVVDDFRIGSLLSIGVNDTVIGNRQGLPTALATENGDRLLNPCSSVENLLNAMAENRRGLEAK